MNKIFIITGANGHLGGTIIRMLKETNVTIRGLILKSEEAKNLDNINYIKGDICDKESLRPLFENIKNKEVYVIHTAGIIDISDSVSPLIYDVNVNGTRNIVSLCKEYNINRLIHVSSVHAIPEKNKHVVLGEVEKFSPDEVVGWYAKTKAEATQVVLDAVNDGLNAIVVHPSGILGPYDKSGNHLVQMVEDYIHDRLPACVNGGYDFVDVRDVAYGCLKAVKKGRIGECYILSNRHYQIKEILNIIKAINGGLKLPILSMWTAKAAAPILQWYAKIKNERPLYTKYSLYTVNSNDRFSHDKATYELGYRPRDIFETLQDIISWVCNEKQIV